MAKRKFKSSLDDIDRAVLALAYTLQTYGLSADEIEAELHARVTQALSTYRTAPQPQINLIS